MKTKTFPLSFSLAEFYCLFFGHKYRVSNFVTEHIKEYQCSFCKEEITDTANGSIAKLTDKFKETNEYLAQFHEKRTRKTLRSA